MTRTHGVVSAVVVLLALSGLAPALAQSASNVTFVAFDLETTGFSAQQGRIIEIGAVRFRGDTLLDQRQWLINPGLSIAPGATAVHGITDAMVTNAPAFEAVYAEFLAFVGSAVLLAHNARFDIGFIAAEARRHELPLPPGAVIDTLALARHRYPGAESHRLEALVELLNLPQADFHRGLVDALHVKTLINALMAGDLATLDGLLAVGQVTYPQAPPAP